MRKFLFIASGVTALLLAPLLTLADAYQFKAQGIFGCNQTGSYAMSVGSMAAIGGVYVPVNDAAVTLNTGYLVYLQCVLANVINRQKESTMTAYVAQDTKYITTGRSGNAMFIQQIGPENKVIGDKSTLYSLNHNMNTIVSQYQAPIRQKIAQNYLAPDDFSCSYNASDPNDVWASVRAVGDANCNPLFLLNNVENNVTMRRNTAVNDFMTAVGWGNGFYPNADVNDDGSLTIKTPSYVVAQDIVQTLGMGRQMGADLNGVIGSSVQSSLFQALMTNAVASTGGLVGLAQSTGGTGSYIDQMTSQSSSNLFSTSVSTALQSLSGAYSLEQSYNQVLNQIYTLVNGIISQVQGQETTCWTLIIKKVCGDPYTLDANNVCTVTTSGTTVKYKVATSTTNSQQVINANNLLTIASSTQSAITTSNALLSTFAQIAAQLNSSNTSTQNAALAQWDTLVAQGHLHNQADLGTLSQQYTTYQTSFGNIVSDNATNWGENSGWCNINDAGVLQSWKDAWRQP